jgi:hypothetical protein
MRAEWILFIGCVPFQAEASQHHFQINRCAAGKSVWKGDGSKITNRRLQMRLFRLCMAVSLSFCLIVFAAAAWSTESAGAPEKIGGVAVEAAVITKIDNDLITLQSLTDNNKVFVISMRDNGMLKVGDKVSVQGNSVKKLDAVSDPAPQADTIHDPVQKAVDPNQPAVSPDPATKTGDQP